MAQLNIGLLLTYNEVDVIEEVLTANAPAVDAIYALDGSDDGTHEVIASHPKTALLLRDEDVVGPGGRVRDFHRQALLDAARNDHGRGHWYTLLHGDEIFHDDPRAVVSRAEAQGAWLVNWAAMQFFLHVSDAGQPEDGPVQERLTWYSPFWIEVRQFRDREAVRDRAGPRDRGGPRDHEGPRYRQGEHGRVVPRGVPNRAFGRLPVLKHYPYRSRAQVESRLRSIAGRGFSGSAQEPDVYRRTYEPRYRKALRFDGDFGNLEMDRQGPLWLNILRWKLWT